MRVLLVLLAVSGTAAAAPGEWARTFAPDLVGSYLEPDRPAVLVVPAGSSDADAAAEALATGLRLSGRARLVMDAAALGDLHALEDAAIVARAAPVPVNSIAVVRVFAGARRANAVVTFYDKRGKALIACTAEEGVALAARPQESGQGVSSSAASAVDDVMRNAPPAPPQPYAPGYPPPPGGVTYQQPQTPAEAEYARLHIGFYHYTMINVYGAYQATLSSGWGGPYQGVTKAPLDPDEFYRAVGRNDYADTYARRRARKLGMVVPGVLVMLAGPALIIAGAVHSFCTAQDPLGSCTTSRNDPSWGLLAPGIVGTVVGLALTIAGGVIRTAPTSDNDNYRLAAEHNRKLRKRLNLPAAREDLIPPFSLAPVITPTGGGLAARVIF